jgi:hypothetical protein
MPRYDLEEDYDDLPGRRRTSPLVLIAIVAGVMGLCIMVTCSGWLLYGFGAAPPVAAPAPPVNQPIPAKPRPVHLELRPGFGFPPEPEPERGPQPREVPAPP